MPGQSRVNGNLSSFFVANFTNHYDVRVLSQSTVQAFGKSIIFAFINLSLNDAWKMIFNRVFNGNYFYFWSVDFFQKSVESSGLAGASRTRIENHPVWFANFPLKNFFEFLRNSQLLQRYPDRVWVKKAKHNRLSVGAGKNRRADFNITVLDFDAEAPVLGGVLDIELKTGEQFDARKKQVIGLTIKVEYVGKAAVEPVAQAYISFLRLDMNIGGIGRKPARKDCLEDARDSIHFFLGKKILDTSLCIPKTLDGCEEPMNFFA